MGLSKVGSGVTRTMFINMLPGLVITLIYVFWAAKTLGFLHRNNHRLLHPAVDLRPCAAFTEVKSWLQTRDHHGGLRGGDVRALCHASERLHTKGNSVLTALLRGGNQIREET